MTEKTASPGRPAGFSRDQAIEAAMNLFWRDGYLGVSASDLAAAMNIQRSSFYNSFGSREAVFLEALERYAQGAPDRALDRLRPGDAVIPTFVAVFRELCRQRSADTEARGCLVCNSVGELVGVEDQLGRVLLDAVGERIRIVESLLRQAVSQGELSLQTDVPAAARSFVAFLLGVNLLSKTVRDEQALWRTCEAYLLGLGVPAKALRAPAQARGAGAADKGSSKR